MAKSDDSTNPSALTRRAAMAAAAVSTLVPTTAFSRPLTGRAATDPVLPLWRDWEKQYAEAMTLYAEWQKQENLVYDALGFSGVSVPAPDGGGSVIDVIDHETIDRLLGGEPGSRSLRQRLHAELDARRARWNSAAAAAQLPAAQARHNDAYAQASALAEAIFQTPADSFAGLAAKLALITRIGAEVGESAEFPWPQIHSVFADLRRLASLLAQSE